jgi:hypothetical protein
VELAEIPVPDVLGDDALARLAAALAPMVDTDADREAGLRGAAATITADLDALADLELQVRRTVDEATIASKEIVAYTLPPYWPFMLGSAILMALSGFFVMDMPQWRLPYIMFVGFAMLALGAHYFWRLYRRSQVIGPLQDKFEEREGAARALFGEVAALERSLAAAGFALETETFMPFAPFVRTLASEGEDADAARHRLTQIVTGDVQRRPSEDAANPGAV